MMSLRTVADAFVPSKANAEASIACSMACRPARCIDSIVECRPTANSSGLTVLATSVAFARQSSVKAMRINVHPALTGRIPSRSRLRSGGVMDDHQITHTLRGSSVLQTLVSASSRRSSSTPTLAHSQ